MGINLIGIDLEARLLQAVKDGIKVYEEECGKETRFGEPLIGFCNTSEPIFDMFYDNNLCKLPRKIYNPARAIIVYFLPYTDDVIQSNMQSAEPSDKWIRAYNDSTWAIMKVHASITRELGRFGRLASLCNVPVDWDENKCGPEWNFKMAAYVAGMGKFGPAGCLITEKGPAGRFGAILTDVNLVPDRDFGFSHTESRGNTPELYEEYKKYMRDACFEGPCSPELIASCPAGAISESGIDKKKCQSYCKTLNGIVPTPDVCGKCYFAR